MAGQSTALAERPLSKTQLFCSNLPWSVNGKMLRQAFETHGEVTDAFVAYNGRSSRGFGYVTFKDPAAATTAVTSMNGQPLAERIFSLCTATPGDDDRAREIRVEMARERPAPRPEPRERGDGERGARGARGGRSDRDGESGGGRGFREGGRGRRGDGEGGDGGEGGRGDGRGRRPRPGRGGRGGGGDGGGGRSAPSSSETGVEGAVEALSVTPAAEQPAATVVPLPSKEEDSSES